MDYKELLEKYGNTEVTFWSYYKYNFVFVSADKDDDFVVNVGGTADDIYALNVAIGEEYKVKDLPLYSVYIDDKCIYGGW